MSAVFGVRHEAFIPASENSFTKMGVSIPGNPHNESASEAERRQEQATMQTDARSLAALFSLPSSNLETANKATLEGNHHNLLKDLQEKISDLHKLFFHTEGESLSTRARVNPENINNEERKSIFSNFTKLIKNMIQKGELTTEVAAELAGNLISNAITTGGSAALGVLAGLSINATDASVPKNINPIQAEPTPIVQVEKNKESQHNTREIINQSKEAPILSSTAVNATNLRKQ